MRSKGRAPEDAELGALLRGIWSGHQGTAAAAWRALGRQAVASRSAWRLILDVAKARLSLPAEAAVPALRELLRLAPETVRDLLKPGSPSPNDPADSQPARHVAAIALGRAGGAFLDDLVALAGSDDPAARLAAVAGLAEAATHGSAASVDALETALGDSHSEVRGAAATGLGRARGRNCAAAVLCLTRLVCRAGTPMPAKEQTLLPVALGAVALWPARRRDPVALLVRLAGLGPAGKKAVAAAMRELPRRPVASLAALCISDPDPEVRALGAQALGRWAAQGDDRSRADLQRLAGDSSGSVRAVACSFLAADPNLSELPFMAAAANDRSSRVRASVAEALGRTCRRLETCATALLRQLAKDRGTAVRAAAVRSLGLLGFNRAVAAACLDREPAVRAAAAAGLQPQGAAEVNSLLSLSRDRDAGVARAASRQLCQHVFGLSGPLWERVVEMASADRTATAATEGIAAALDRDPRAAPELLYWWPADGGAPGFFWTLARAARTPEMGELARVAAHIAEDDGAPGELLRELASALHGAGRTDLGRVVLWLAECAEAPTADELARLAAAPPRSDFDIVSFVAAAGRSVAAAWRARSRQVRNRHLGRARAALEVALNHNRDRAYHGVVSPILYAWESLLDGLAQTAARADIRAAVLSERVVAGPRGLLVIAVQNLGQGPARELVVDVEGAANAGRLPSLEPGEASQVKMAIAAVEPGLLEIRGRVRFRHLSGAAVRDFGGRVQVVRPGELAAVPNPFVVGKPLSPNSAMFFGRAAEVAFVERALASGERGGVAVLVGQRRTGKTSLLRHLEAKLSATCKVTFVDVQGMLVADTDAFFAQLAKELLPATRPAGKPAAPAWESRPEGDPGELMVREAASRYGQPVVVLIDEFDDLEQKVRTGLLGPEVLSQLRHLIQHSPNLSFVLSGTHRLEEMAGAYWSSLLNLATYRRVGGLDPEAAADVIRVPLARLGIGCEDAALAHALDLAGGHPYLLQLLGYRLVERCTESCEAVVRLESVEAAVDDIVAQGDIHLRYLWESAGDDGQAVLRSLVASWGGAGPKPALPAGGATRAPQTSGGCAATPQPCGLTAEELAIATGLGRPRLNEAIRRLGVCELVQACGAVGTAAAGMEASPRGPLGFAPFGCAQGKQGGRGSHSPAAGLLRSPRCYEAPRYLLRVGLLGRWLSQGEP